MFALMLGFFGIFNTVDAAVVCDSPNHAIWNVDNSVKVGCITEVDWNAATALRINQADQKDFVNVVRGQRLITTTNTEDWCPTWFPMNCVIKKSLFSRFI